MAPVAVALSSFPLSFLENSVGSGVGLIEYLSVVFEKKYIPIGDRTFLKNSAAGRGWVGGRLELLRLLTAPPSHFT